MSLIPEGEGKLPQPAGAEETMLVLKRNQVLWSVTSILWSCSCLLMHLSFMRLILHTFERYQLFLSLEVSRIKVLLDYLLLIITAQELTLKSFL